jgi:hypothetical protein
MTEIEVMSQLDAILGDLTDESARQRVLDWASAKYGKKLASFTMSNPKFGPDGHLNVPLQGMPIPYTPPDPNQTGVVPDFPGRTIISWRAPIDAGCAGAIGTEITSFWSDTTGCAIGVAHLNPFG